MTLPATTNRLQRKKDRLKERIVAARESGMEIDEVAKHCHCNVATVKKVLFDGVRRAERVQRFNEALVSRGPKGIKVIDEWLAKGSKEVAMWLLENIGAVSKEQIRQLTINATNAQVNLSNDTLEAAKAVAAMMRGVGPARALPAANVVVIKSEEKPNEPNVIAGDGTTSDPSV